MAGKLQLCPAEDLHKEMTKLGLIKALYFICGNFGLESLTNRICFPSYIYGCFGTLDRRNRGGKEKDRAIKNY